MVWALGVSVFRVKSGLKGIALPFGERTEIGVFMALRSALTSETLVCPPTRFFRESDKLGAGYRRMEERVLKLLKRTARVA